jgi:hypothetical protein
MAGRGLPPRGAGKVRAMHRTLPAIAGDFAAGRRAARGSRDRDGGTPKATGVGTDGDRWTGWNGHCPAPPRRPFGLPAAGVLAPLESAHVSVGVSVRQPCEGRVGGEGNAPGGRVPQDCGQRVDSLWMAGRNLRLGIGSLGRASRNLRLRVRSLGIASRNLRLGVRSLGIASRNRRLRIGSLGVVSRNRRLGGRSLGIVSRSRRLGGWSFGIVSRSRRLGGWSFGIVSRSRRLRVRSLGIASRNRRLRVRSLGIASRNRRLRVWSLGRNSRRDWEKGGRGEAPTQRFGERETGRLPAP